MANIYKYGSKEEAQLMVNAQKQIQNIDNVMNNIDSSIKKNNVNISENDLHYFLDSNFTKEQIYSQIEEEKSKKQSQVLVSVDEIRELQRIALAYKESLLKNISDIQTKQKEAELKDIQEKYFQTDNSFIRSYYDTRKQELMDELDQVKTR